MRRALVIAMFVALACRKVDNAPAMRAALAQIRTGIANYHAKTGHYPHALNELGKIPLDPVTHSAQTWHPTLQENVRVDDFSNVAPPPTAAEIVDVHSGAPGTDLNGRPWSDY